MNQLLYGAAYYDEYMPYDRLEKDIAMMKKAGINTIRIAESTWSTCEPQDGVFDFSHVTRVIDICEREGINVIIGTPTYAVPTWMVKAYPDVLATTKNGKGIYGPRQIMDITNPTYLFYAERVIRELMKVTADRKCVIGFQLDNETKYYGTAGKNVQHKFVKYIREKFQDDLDAFNHEFGLDYWSNRINAWEDFPDVRGTINGSLGAEFEKFQRSLVTEFLTWQSKIVSEYKRNDQFITHNFDFEWRGYSYGVQPDVDHYKASRCLSIAGCDIYHPNQSELTGLEIAMGGDLTRSLKQDNYLIIETEAQGFPCWTPYKGQLRLNAYGHLASGANCVMYWHWHSLHNSMETYWKGILSHDFQENEVYREASIVGNEWKKIGNQLVNLKKKNDVAILVSNEALTALKWFGIQATAGGSGNVGYNDIMRWIYNTLYKMNIECDFIWPETEDLSSYSVVIVPALYAVSDHVLERLKDYIKNGGHLIATFKTGFTNENVKVSTSVQPRIIGEALGISYDQFTFPTDVSLSGELYQDMETGFADIFMELVRADQAKILASYEHSAWNEYAAITEHSYGSGMGYYLGCKTDDHTLVLLLTKILKKAGIEIPCYQFPLIIRKGRNDEGKQITYYLNYSEKTTSVINTAGKEIISETMLNENDILEIPAWGVKIISN